MTDPNRRIFDRRDRIETAAHAHLDIGVIRDHAPGGGDPVLRLQHAEKLRRVYAECRKLLVREFEVYLFVLHAEQVPATRSNSVRSRSA